MNVGHEINFDYGNTSGSSGALMSLIIPTKIRQVSQIIFARSTKRQFMPHVSSARFMNTPVPPTAGNRYPIHVPPALIPLPVEVRR